MEAAPRLASSQVRPHAALSSVPLSLAHLPPGRSTMASYSRAAVRHFHGPRVGSHGGGAEDRGAEGAERVGASSESQGKLLPDPQSVEEGRRLWSLYRVIRERRRAAPRPPDGLHEPVIEVDALAGRRWLRQLPGRVGANGDVLDREALAQDPRESKPRGSSRKACGARAEAGRHPREHRR